MKYIFSSPHPPICELFHFIQFCGAPNKGREMCSKSQGIHIYTQSINANPIVGERPTHIITAHRWQPKEYQIPIALEVQSLKEPLLSPSRYDRAPSKSTWWKPNLLSAQSAFSSYTPKTWTCDTLLHLIHTPPHSHHVQLLFCWPLILLIYLFSMSPIAHLSFHSHCYVFFIRHPYFIPWFNEMAF